MKFFLFPILLLLLPFLTFAQNEPALYKDFYSGIKAANSVVLNDHVNIIQVNTDNENFDVEAINDQMQVLWKTSIEGFAFSVVKVKDKIVAIAATDHSGIKGANNTYKAYLIDPANGKTLIEKVIYTGDDNFLEFPAVFTGDGNYLKFCVRRSGFERRMHVELPSFLGIISLNKYARELNETKELNVITLNDKLETINSVKPQLSNGTMMSWCGNKQSDLFIAWLNGPTIEVYKYSAGSSSPVKQLNADVELREDRNAMMENIELQYVRTSTLNNVLQFLPSSTNPNILYYGLTYLDQDKVQEIGIGKFDFSAGTKSYVTEALDKAHVKALQKDFVPVNKKIDNPELVWFDGFDIKYMGESEGNLIVALRSSHWVVSTNTRVLIGNSLLVNGYNPDLTTKFQQILPTSGYFAPNSDIGYHVAKNKFFIVTNGRKGLMGMEATYGCLDVNKGVWDKMDILSKKKIDNSARSNGGAILWFGNNFVVPYFSPRGLTQSKADITLQQNDY